MASAPIMYMDPVEITGSLPKNVTVPVPQSNIGLAMLGGAVAYMLGFKSVAALCGGWGVYELVIKPGANGST